jgi:ABC-type multidrug transport system, ATPase and permease components
MLKLVKFLKPFVAGILICVLLLFVQAMCELRLPDYMSDVVDVGISKSGIEHGAPDHISRAGIELVNDFLIADIDPLCYVSNQSGGFDINQSLTDEMRTELDLQFGRFAWNMINYLKLPQVQTSIKGSALIAEDNAEDFKKFVAATMSLSPETLAKANSFEFNFDTIDQKIAAGNPFYAIARTSENYGEGTNVESFYPLIKAVYNYAHLQYAGVASGNVEITTRVSDTDYKKLAKSFCDNLSAADVTGSFSGADDTNLQEVNVSQLYQLTPLIQNMPPELLVEANKQTNEIDEFLLSQTSSVIAKAFLIEQGVDVNKLQNDYIIGVGLRMLLVTAISGIATILVSLFASRIAGKLAKNLRGAVYNKVMAFGKPEFDKFSSASLITRTTNDITQIQMFLTFGLRMIFYAPIMATGALIMATQKSVSMLWILGAAIAVLVGLIICLLAFALPKFKMMQKLVDRLNLVSRETLTGLPVIRAFGREAHEKERFDKANQEVAKTNLFVNRAMAFLMPVIILVMNGLSVLVIWVGSKGISNSTMAVGDMLAFMQYSIQVVLSFIMFSMMFVFIPRASVSSNRIAEVLETEITVAEPKSPASIEDNKKRGTVEFKNVSFSYGGEEDALSNVSFVAKPGKTIGFIGATGAGKSTLVNLIPRFYDATKGQVLIDGIDVKDIPLHDLRGEIGLVPQKSVLLSGTIESNIKYGMNGNEIDIDKIAEISQAKEFIDGKEEKYQSDIAQGGHNVSGGQKQRLAIARALATDAPILIFDDSFSALDFSTDAALRKSLAKNCKKKTVIIVAQRISTIKNADTIYVLDEGEIVGRGTHTELLQNCAEYCEIVLTQLGEEALDAEIEKSTEGK